MALFYPPPLTVRFSGSYHFLTAKEPLYPPFLKAMRNDVYDLDENKWSCWISDRGFVCDWMSEKEYQKWYYVQYGVMGRKLPGLRTIYRSEAEEKEKVRKHGSKGV